MPQISFDGTEGDPPDVSPAAPLSGAQHDIMAHVREHGAIRSVQAGTIAHRHRGRPLHEPTWARSGWSGAGCCPYASSDGNEVCKRLLARGLLARDPDQKGRWIAAGGA